MVELGTLEQYCNTLLSVDEVSDYCPNGLQVEGDSSIKKIVSAVTASESVIEKAIAEQAQVLLVHHGYFWKGESSNVVGMKKRRLKLLLENNISLLAYHLPLDLHQQFGNNVMLAKQLGFEVNDFFDVPGVASLGAMTEFNRPMTPSEIIGIISESLGRKPMHIAPANDQGVKRLAWITGAAQDYIEVAHANGCDGFISGEVSERTYYAARELGIHYFAAGHHATERYGVQALAAHISQKFDLQHIYIDEPNPV